MTDKKTEALKLALEALEYISSHYMSLPKIGCMALAAGKEALAEQCVCGEPDTPGTHRTDGPCLAEQPAQQQEPVTNTLGSEWVPCVKLPVTVHVRQQRQGEAHISTREGITPVRPDDLIMRGVSGEEYPIGREIFERTYQLGEALAEQPAQHQESVAWIVQYANDHKDIDFYEQDIEELPIGTKLYTSPPASKPWVGLTDEEVKHLWEVWRANSPRYVGFAIGIEAKLKEKNQ